MGKSVGIAAIVTLLGFVVMSPAQADEGCGPKDVGLPSPMKVVQPSPYAAWTKYGARAGQWGDSPSKYLCHLLAIESIDASGQATLIYAWGRGSDGFDHKYGEVSGSIDGNTLTTRAPSGKPVVYKLDPQTGTLSGEWNNWQTGTFNPVKLAVN